jgi:hypothetical protein
VEVINVATDERVQPPRYITLSRATNPKRPATLTGTNELFSGGVNRTQRVTSTQLGLWKAVVLLVGSFSTAACY